jgi:hypothetical protein
MGCGEQIEDVAFQIAHVDTMLWLGEQLDRRG